jgi:hypothetical protein
VTSVAFNSSPSMDLTGYRQRETIEPRAPSADFIVEPSALLAAAGGQYVTLPAPGHYIRKSRKPSACLLTPLRH